MSIKLNAQSGGSVALDAPTQTTSSADLTFKLPVADGSNGQVIQTNGSGQLAFATPSTGSMTLLTSIDFGSTAMAANTVSYSLNLTGYHKLVGEINGLALSGNGTLNDTWFTFNGITSSGYYAWVRQYLDNSSDTSTGRAGSNTGFAYGSVGPGFFYNGAGFAGFESLNNEGEFTVHNLQTGGKKLITMSSSGFLTRNMVFDTTGRINITSAITSFDVNVYLAAHRLTAGTIKLYGVK